MAQIKYRIRLKEGSSGTFVVRDRQHLKSLTPGETLVIYKDSMDKITDPNIEIVEEILETTLGETLPVNSRVNEEMAASYEEQIQQQNKEIWRLKAQIDSLEKTVSKLEADLKDPWALEASKILSDHFKVRVNRILSVEEPRVLKQVLRKLKAKPDSKLTRTDINCIKAAENTLAALESDAEET